MPINRGLVKGIMVKYKIEYSNILYVEHIFYKYKI